MREPDSQADPADGMVTAEAIEAYLAAARDGGDIEVMSEAQVNAARALNRHGVPVAALGPWVAAAYPNLSALAAQMAGDGAV